MNRVLLIALFVVFLASTALQAWLLHDRLTNANQNRADNAKVWRAVICQIETTSLAKTTDQAQRRLIVSFYDGLLRQDVNTSGCGLNPQGAK